MLVGWIRNRREMRRVLADEEVALELLPNRGDGEGDEGRVEGLGACRGVKRHGKND